MCLGVQSLSRLTGPAGTVLLRTMHCTSSLAFIPVTAASIMQASKLPTQKASSLPVAQGLRGRAPDGPVRYRSAG